MHLPRAPLASCAAVLVAAAAGYGCADASGIPPGWGSFTAQQAASVQTIQGAQAEEVTVGPDALVFPASGNEGLLSLPAGVVLVGYPARSAGAKGNPYGFLRRVQSVESSGADLVVRTTPASLSDAFTTLDVDVRGATLTGSTQSQAQYRPLDLPGFGAVDLSGGVLGDSDVSVSVTGGSFSFDPSLDVGVHIASGSASEFHAVATGEVSLQLDLDVTVNAAKTLWQQEKDIDVGPPVLLPTPPPVFIFAQPTLTLSCSVTASATGDVTAGLTASSQVSVGVRYDGTSWQPVGSQSFTFAPDGQVQPSAAVTARCDVKPGVSLLLYDLAGPDVTLDPHAQLVASRDGSGGTSWELDAGVAADVGIDLGFLGDAFQDPNLSLSLFDVSQKVAGGDLPGTGSSSGGSSSGSSGSGSGSGSSGGSSGGSSSSSGSGSSSGSSSSSSGGSSGAGGCVPTVTCQSAGVGCDWVDDGCGNPLFCGTCPSGETCSNGTCVSAGCTPTVTCQSAGAACGSVDDGCGNSLGCGPCPAGETCSGNQCVATGAPCAVDCAKTCAGGPLCLNGACGCTTDSDCANDTMCSFNGATSCIGGTCQ